MNFYGQCWWQDGTSYQGQWRNCVKEGQGILIYADGSVYTGMFQNDFPNGQGRKNFKDSSVYTGTFKNGHFHGFGKYKQPLEQIEYEGNWIHNEIKGEGIKKMNNGEI